MGEHSRGAGRGQALVEFALVIPILLLALFGILDAGRLIYAYNTIANSARDGARVAIVNQANAGTNTCDTTAPTVWATGCAIASSPYLGLTPSDVSVQYRNPDDSGPCIDAGHPTLYMGCLAVVTVTGHFDPVTPVIGSVIGHVTLTSTAKMPIEFVVAAPGQERG